MRKDRPCSAAARDDAARRHPWSDRRSTPAARPGDVPTWDEVVEQHSDRVYRLAYRLTGNRPDAEDLTQEVFVRVFRSLRHLHARHLRGLAAPDHHQPLPRPGPPQAADPLRRALRRARRPADQRARPRPDAAYADRTFDDDVERALATLPPDFRAAVVLCDVEGLTYEEIAEILDAKLGTVRSRIHRGRAMLRTALAHRAPAEGRARYSGPATARRPRRRGARRDRPPRLPRQRPARRPARRRRGGARLGARPRLPPLPRPRRARGLGQDPAGRALLRRPDRRARPASRARCSAPQAGAARRATRYLVASRTAPAPRRWSRSAAAPRGRRGRRAGARRRAGRAPASTAAPPATDLPAVRPAPAPASTTARRARHPPTPAGRALVATRGRWPVSDRSRRARRPTEDDQRRAVAPSTRRRRAAAASPGRRDASGAGRRPGRRPPLPTAAGSRAGRAPPAAQPAPPPAPQPARRTRRPAAAPAPADAGLPGRTPPPAHAAPRGRVPRWLWPVVCAPRAGRRRARRRASAALVYDQLARRRRRAPSAAASTASTRVRGAAAGRQRLGRGRRAGSCCPAPCRSSPSTTGRRAAPPAPASCWTARATSSPTTTWSPTPPRTTARSRSSTRTATTTRPTVVGRSPVYDLAVLYVDGRPRGSQPAALGRLAGAAASATRSSPSAPRSA